MVAGELFKAVNRVASSLETTKDLLHYCLNLSFELLCRVKILQIYGPETEILAC